MPKFRVKLERAVTVWDVAEVIIEAPNDDAIENLALYDQIEVGDYVTLVDDPCVGEWELTSVKTIKEDADVRGNAD
jgi:hypothetical protein